MHSHAQRVQRNGLRVKSFINASEAANRNIPKNKTVENTRRSIKKKIKMHISDKESIDAVFKEDGDF